MLTGFKMAHLLSPFEMGHFEVCDYQAISIDGEISTCPFFTFWNRPFWNWAILNFCIDLDHEMVTKFKVGHFKSKNNWLFWNLYAYLVTWLICNRLFLSKPFKMAHFRSFWGPWENFKTYTAFIFASTNRNVWKLWLKCFFKISRF